MSIFFGSIINIIYEFSITTKQKHKKLCRLNIFKYNCTVFNRTNNSIIKIIKAMIYKKPKILAQGTEEMAQCRPNSKPSGRPCNPPKPGGR